MSSGTCSENMALKDGLSKYLATNMWEVLVSLPVGANAQGLTAEELAEYVGGDVSAARTALGEIEQIFPKSLVARGVGNQRTYRLYGGQSTAYLAGIMWWNKNHGKE